MRITLSFSGRMCGPTCQLDRSRYVETVTGSTGKVTKNPYVEIVPSTDDSNKTNTAESEVV